MTSADDPEFFRSTSGRGDTEREEFVHRQRANPNGADGQPHAPSRRFKLVRFRDIKFDSTTTKDIIQGIFPTDGLIVIWGPPKCCKSFWVYDAAMHVARGKPYRERRVVQGIVVYVACEGERGLKARTEAYRQILPDDADPPFYLMTTQLDLIAQCDELIGDIRAQLGAQTCILIVVDTLNRSLSGSENKPEDMTDYIRAADKLRGAFAGSSVALIHHCGVDGNRPRGFTGLSGAADAQIAVKRDADGTIAVTVEYMKDGREGDIINSKLRVIEIGLDDNHDLITSCIIEPASTSGTTRPLKGKPRPKLIPRDQIALDTLHKALAAAGEHPPPHNHIPASVTVVSIDLWRRFYLAATSGNDQPENTRRKALLRAREALQAKKMIGTWDEMVWEI